MATWTIKITSLWQFINILKQYKHQKQENWHPSNTGATECSPSINGATDICTHLAFQAHGGHKWI